MALAQTLSQILLSKPSTAMKIKLCSNINQRKPETSQISIKKLCLKCTTLYIDQDNSPTACSFHGHATGEKGLYAFAPPHQGIDGEWSDRSGAIVYKWNEKNNRPNTGRRDGVVVPSMTRMLHHVNKDGMSPMMMASLCISHIQLKCTTLSQHRGVPPISSKSIALFL